MNPRHFYEARANSILKEVREERNISYKELARRLEAYGVVMDVQALINRVNKGKFSFTFALQVLAAMGVEHLEIPKVTGGASGPRAAHQPDDDAQDLE